MFITNSCNLQIEKCKVVYYLISVYNSDYCIRFHLKFITYVYFVQRKFVNLKLRAGNKTAKRVQFSFLTHKVFQKFLIYLVSHIIGF